MSKENMEKFNSLPGELKLRILSYLPHNVLFSFKGLNREYRDLITNTGFQTNQIFNSYKDFINKIPEVLINFIKTAIECPLEYAYTYLSLRGHPENIIVLRAELSPLKNKDRNEDISTNLRIYVKAKAVRASEVNQEANLIKILENLRLSDSLLSIYQTPLKNPDFVRLIKSIKVCQRLVVREKDEIHPMADIDHVPGPEVIELFSTDPLYSRDPNANDISNFINENGIVDYDSLNRRFTTVPMKTVLLNYEKGIPILHGYLASGLVLELHNMLFPIIETYEYITDEGKDNSNPLIKRTFRLQPLKQIDSFSIINVKDLNSNMNKATISKLQTFVQDLFRYICTCC